MMLAWPFVVGVVAVLIVIPLSILTLTTLAASPQAKPAAQTPPTPAAGQPPAFDGNVANLVWGARVESVTGETQTAHARTILVDPFAGKAD